MKEEPVEEELMESPEETEREISERDRKIRFRKAFLLPLSLREVLSPLGDLECSTSH